MRVCIFEDDGFKNLYPLTYLRPVFELMCGATTLREKIERAYPNASFCYLVREAVAPVFARRTKGPVNDLASLKQDDLLLINGRMLLLGDGPSPEREGCFICDGALAYARLDRNHASSLAASTGEAFLAEVRGVLPSKEVEATLISYPWELIDHNGEAIKEDFKRRGKSGLHGTISTLVSVWGDEKQVYVAPGAEVQPFVAFDTTHGPIIVEEGVVISPHTRIEGPAFIGRDSRLVGGKIREGTTIGPVCRVGGEVEESIIHGYSNKYHDGFLGHAYVCEWVNLGALTTNSDLKNDYSSVQVQIGGEMIDSGSTKVGCFIGDHTKTSIGTYFNTGTVVGVMCNLVGGSGIMPKFIPSFTMQLHGKFFKVSLNAQLETARIAMSRRKVQLSPEEENLIRYTFELTREERAEAVRKSRRELAAEKGLE